MTPDIFTPLLILFLIGFIFILRPSWSQIVSLATVAIVLTGCLLLEGCRKKDEPISIETPVAIAPVEPTAQEKIEAVQRGLNAKAAFLKLCDNNGGLKDYDDAHWDGSRGSPYRSLIICNNGLATYYNYSPK